jgi:hypothetical protein
MARLNWLSVMAQGSRVVNSSNDLSPAFKFSFPDSSPPVPGVAALLILSARNVDHDNNFITLNMTGSQALQLDDIQFSEAKNIDVFVSRIFSTTSKWTPQIHRIAGGKLQATNNQLGFHARNSDGKTFPLPLDNFQVARIFIVYTSS